MRRVFVIILALMLCISIGLLYIQKNKTNKINNNGDISGNIDGDNNGNVAKETIDTNDPMEINNEREYQDKIDSIDTEELNNDTGNKIKASVITAFPGLVGTDIVSAEEKEQIVNDMNSPDGNETLFEVLTTSDIAIKHLLDDTWTTYYNKEALTNNNLTKTIGSNMNGFITKIESPGPYEIQRYTQNTDLNLTVTTSNLHARVVSPDIRKLMVYPGGLMKLEAVGESYVRFFVKGLEADSITVKSRGLDLTAKQTGDKLVLQSPLIKTFTIEYLDSTSTLNKLKVDTDEDQIEIIVVDGRLQICALEKNHTGKRTRVLLKQDQVK